jgi:hypothetical protein
VGFKGDWLEYPAPWIFFDMVAQSLSYGIGHDVVGYAVKVFVGPYQVIVASWLPHRTRNTGLVRYPAIPAFEAIDKPQRRSAIFCRSHHEVEMIRHDTVHLKLTTGFDPLLE